jgi:hypothetical protein
MPRHTTGLTADPDGWHGTRRRGEQPWRCWCKSPIRYENTQSLCAHHHNMHRQHEKRGQLIERSGIREAHAASVTRACQARDDRSRGSRVRAL